MDWLNRLILMIKVGIKSKGFPLERKVKRMVNQMQDDMFEEVKSTTPVDTGRARKAWRQTSEGANNPLEYVKFLDRGSSKQAPDGMSSPALNTLKSNLRKGKYK